jgi:hypothetical protein
VRRAVGALIALVACGAPAAPPTDAPALAAYLDGLRRADALTRAREIADWQLDEPTWCRTVVAAYQPLYAAYARAFAAAAPAVFDQLTRTAPPITARRHFAGDPRLTAAQGRDRWALPTLAPSLVADAGGAPIDTVFLADGGRWRALLGLDAAVRDRVAAVAAACAGPIARAGPAGRCSDVGAAIITAVLRNDSEQVAHLCPLADTLCGKGSP